MIYNFEYVIGAVIKEAIDKRHILLDSEELNTQSKLNKTVEFAILCKYLSYED